MKHIKLFENFESELYTKISEEEFEKLIGSHLYFDDVWDSIDSKWVDFTKDDSEKIFSYFQDCKYEFEMWKGQSKKLLSIWKEYSDDEIDNLNSSLYISIYKINDEWWVVDENQDEFVPESEEMIDHHTFYKCDQLEGLIQLLNDKKYFS